MPCVLPLTYALSGFGVTAALSIGTGFPLPGRRIRWAFEPTHTSGKPMAWRYPPGFQGRLESVFTPLVRSRLNRTLERLRSRSGSDPWVIAPFPRDLRYLGNVTQSRLVYLNHDDYSSYDVHGRDTPAPLEKELAERAGTIVCNSRVQADRFRERFPLKADAVFHLPHGVHETAFNTVPDAAPKPETVCVVGALSGRYDWDLVLTVIRSMPSVLFTFAGELDHRRLGNERPGWVQSRDAVLRLPNVRHVHGYRDWELADVYRSHAVNWMPYDITRPFVRACCPLKLFNGLASGRQVVSADVPESRLHADWVRVFDDAAAAVALLKDALARARSPQEPARVAAQVLAARRHEWSHRATQLIAILER